MKELRDFMYQRMESTISQLQLQEVGEGYATQNMVDMVFKGQFKSSYQPIMNYSSSLVREEEVLVMSFL